jgi:hypothetical protein
LNTDTTDPRWFAHWWAAQQDRSDSIGHYADEVYAEGLIPLHPTPLHEITEGHHENFVGLVEEAWFEWEDEMRESPWGWSYIENLLNNLYPQELERGPNHRVLPLPPKVEHPVETWLRENGYHR